MKPKVSVVIPNLNGRHFIGECLDSLALQSYEDFETIVVDNGSSDGSADYIKEKYPKIIVVEKEKNYGFAGGVNIGIRVAKGKYVALLNNDAIAEKNWLKYLMETAESKKFGDLFAVTSKILQQKKEDGRSIIDTTGDELSIYGTAFPRGRDEIDNGQYEKEEEVFGGCGGATLYEKETLNQVGLFDEDFFAYYEDVDISFRARLRGYKTYYQPKAVVYHQLGATSGGSFKPFTLYHSTKNLFYLYFKNMPTPFIFKYLPRFAFHQLWMLGVAIRRLLLLSYLKGVLIAIVNIPSTLKKRKYIQKSKVISNKQLERLLYKKLPPPQEKKLKALFGRNA